MNLRRFFAFAVFAIPALAQLAPPNDAGVTLGHIQLTVKDVDVQRKFWLEMMGGQGVRNGTLDLIRFPGVYIMLRQGDPTGPPAGSIVNHFGFSFRDLPSWLAKWKANGVEIEQDQNPNQGYVHAPDGIRIEFFGDPSLRNPVVIDHIHFWPTEMKPIQAWYAKAFGGRPGQRPRVSTPGWVDCDFFPGVNFSFSPHDESPVGTKGRSIDHIGLEVKNIDAFVRKLEAKGIKLDTPVRQLPNSKTKEAFLTDPWGTYIELTENFAPGGN